MQNSELVSFLDRLVHDLREPLRSITAFSEVLKEQSQTSDAEYHRVLDEILQGGARIRVLTDALSLYSLSLEPRDENCSTQLKLAFELATMKLDKELRETGATVNADGLDGDVAVRLERLTQLLGIFLSNSIRFHSESAPVIQLSCTKDTGSYKVRIEDNGIGIAPGDREKIFLPFTRIYGRKYPGAGLGLTIARQIIENYGGSITVEPSAENAVQGVALVFTLPEA